MIYDGEWISKEKRNKSIFDQLLKMVCEKSEREGEKISAKKPTVFYGRHVSFMSFEIEVANVCAIWCCW